MKYRSTLFYLIAALIAAGLFFFDKYHGEEKKRLEEKSKILVKTDLNQIDKIFLERKGDRIQIDKIITDGNDGWLIVDPIKTGAEKFAIESFKQDLSDLSYSRLISENAGSLSQYGLDEPSLVIKFFSQKESETLSFGGQNPSGDGYYVSTGHDNKVYLVDKGAKEKVDMSLFQFRDKDLFRIPFEKIKGLSIEQDSRKWFLEKKEGQWQFKDDPDFKVDSSKIDSLLRMFTIAQASSFEKETAGDLEPFGLKRPAAIVRLSGDGKEEVLLLGKTFGKDDAKIFAKMGDKPQVVTVDKWLLSDIPKTKLLLREVEQDQTKEEGTKSGSPLK